MLETLDEKEKSVSWNRENRKVWYVLFSVSGFTDTLEKVALQREDVMLINQ